MTARRRNEDPTSLTLRTHHNTPLSHIRIRLVAPMHSIVCSSSIKAHDSDIFREKVSYRCNSIGSRSTLGPATQETAVSPRISQNASRLYCGVLSPASISRPGKGALRADLSFKATVSAAPIGARAGRANHLKYRPTNALTRTIAARTVCDREWIATRRVLRSKRLLIVRSMILQRLLSSRVDLRADSLNGEIWSTPELLLMAIRMRLGSPGRSDARGQAIRPNPTVEAAFDLCASVQPSRAAC